MIDEILNFCFVHCPKFFNLEYKYFLKKTEVFPHKKIIVFF